MLTKKLIRRNTLVVYWWNPAFAGRVIRVLEDGSVFWVTFTGRFMIHWPEALMTGNYPVWYRRNGKILPEMNVRNFKRFAARFHGSYAWNTPLDYKEIFDGRKAFTREQTLMAREQELRRKEYEASEAEGQA